MGTTEVLGGERERKGSPAGREGRRKGGSSASTARIAAPPLDQYETYRVFHWKSPPVPRKRSVYSLEGSRDRREAEGNANSPRALFCDGSRFGFFEAFRAINPSTDRLG